MMVLTVPRLGAERSDRQYQMATLAESGATLAFGSDWPVSSAAPLDGIAVATSRTTAEGLPAGGWVPSEILTAETALTAYSAGVARQAFSDTTTATWGQIDVGASADLVWLDTDPRTVNSAQMPSIGIHATYLAGATTHHALNTKDE